MKYTIKLSGHVNTGISIFLKNLYITSFPRVTRHASRVTKNYEQYICPGYNRY